MTLNYSEEKDINSGKKDKYTNDKIFKNKTQEEYSSDNSIMSKSDLSNSGFERDEYSSDSSIRFKIDSNHSGFYRDSFKHNIVEKNSKIIPKCLLNNNFIGKNPLVDFTKTVAYVRIKEFILKINNSIKSECQIEYLDDFLVEIDKIIENTSLSNEPVRFANAAMKTVIEKICILTDQMYLQESFGNKIRMDFGTGHEMNFLCYLYTKYIKNEIKLAYVFSILKMYFRVIRKYLRKYNVEAAGARGCWSIDDYQLLPYLFGSIENFKLSRPISTIFEGAFYEAWSYRKPTDLLKSICTMDWSSINNRMIDMYDKEVFNKKVVTQHFIYSKYLPDTLQEDEN